MMDARGLISKLRHRDDLSEAEARWIGLSLAGPEISDAQVGALAMAISLNGMDKKSRTALTEGMRDSGDVLTWDLPGPVLDKHSTGGVGDPVSLLLAPALAACGAYVPMISGRGLGHTGGTLDKLESIPGYICDVGPKRLNHIVSKVGCAIVGAGGRVAPSDRRLYAIRDVTGTVKSVDLITASILSKKLAAGLDGLILDVKTGSGAFMNERTDAVKLARSLVDVANGAGCKTAALVTDMSQPLSNSAGNALEIRSIMASLTGAERSDRLQSITIKLGGVLLTRSGLAKDAASGEAMISSTFASGAAAEIFAKMVAEMGGPMHFAETWKHCLPEAPILREVAASQSGFISEIDTRLLGETVVSLGGGRLRETDKVNHAVGLSRILRIGCRVERGTPIAVVHAQSESAADGAVASVGRAITISAKATVETPLVLEEVMP